MVIVVGEDSLYSLNFVDKQLILSEDKSDIYIICHRKQMKNISTGDSINIFKMQYVIAGNCGK